MSQPDRSAFNDDVQPLPIQTDFPIEWENPEDEKSFWTRDRMHMPDPISPMEFSIIQLMSGSDSDARLINGYLYRPSKPDSEPTEESESEEQKKQEQVQADMGRLTELWEQEWLPEILVHMAFWDAFDLAGASMADLLNHWEETVDHFKALWGMHSQIVVPAKLAIGQLDELYQDLFGRENAFGAFELLEGLDNHTVAMGRDLWALSREALNIPEVHATLATGNWPQVSERLDQTEAGRRFRTQIDAYLTQYGQRGDKMSVRAPAWIEDPTPMLETLRGYMAQPERDLQQKMADGAKRRERRIEEVQGQLAGYPQTVTEQFEFLLKAAQAGNIVGEDHNYWIDFRSFFAMRRVLLEFGRRLAHAGALIAADDVFFLSLEEMVEGAASLIDGNQPTDHRSTVAQRQANFARFEQIDAPAALGTPMPESVDADNLTARTFRKFGGGTPLASPEPGTIQGNAGSPGVVTGLARIVRSLSQTSDLVPGEILVAVTTMPAWTPLFATAAAVVTDTGGILSHCAVVAREYGIPAVVGTGSASRQIRTGQQIEVDGNTGTVRLLEG